LVIVRPRLAQLLVPLVLALATLSLEARVATAQQIEATIDRAEATTQDQLTLTLTVEGAQNAEPQLPELPDFEVYSGNRSSQMSIVNGRASVRVSYGFVLIPKHTGTFTIGSATVEVGGRVYSSRPFRVRILDPSDQPQESRDVFVTAKVSTTKPYVGQQVIYTWRFYRRLQVGDAQLDQQTFDGFLVENLGDAKTFQTTVNGMQFAVHEIRKALFPQEEGPVTVPGSRLNCQIIRRSSRRNRGLFDDFFGSTTTEAKVLQTPPIELDVRPLPAAPAGFSGLVGSFDLGASMSKRDLKVGESATLTLTVSGTGNAQMISEPALPPLPRFKLYADKPGGSVERGDTGLFGRRTYRKALVPLEAGELTVPGLSLTYFDPEAGSYQTARTQPITLAVAPADGHEELRLTESIAPTTGKVAVKILADDILPLRKNLDALEAPPLGNHPSLALAAGLGLPPILYLALLAAVRRRRRFAQDSGLRRRREALKTAHRGLQEISSGNATAAAQQASLCLRRYIGDKLGVEGSALTPAEARELLRDKAVADEVVEQTTSLLARLESAQYGAASVDPSGLRGQLEDILKKLEGALK
jgi:BatD DUF11 like domain